MCLIYFFLRPPHLLYSGHLDHPPHVGRVDFMVNEPLCQVGPLIWRAAVDWEAGLCMLVLTLFQIMGYFLLRAKGTVCHTQRDILGLFFWQGDVWGIWQGWACLFKEKQLGFLKGSWIVYCHKCIPYKKKKKTWTRWYLYDASKIVSSIKVVRF